MFLSGLGWVWHARPRLTFLGNIALGRSLLSFDTGNFGLIGCDRL